MWAWGQTRTHSWRPSLERMQRPIRLTPVALGSAEPTHAETSEEETEDRTDHGAHVTASDAEREAQDDRLSGKTVHRNYQVEEQPLSPNGSGTASHYWDTASMSTIKKWCGRRDNSEADPLHAETRGPSCESCHG